MDKEKNTLFLLFDVGISIHNLNKKAEKTLGLSLVQRCVLKHLIDLPGVSALQLSRSVGVHPSTLTQTLRRLQKKDLVLIVEDPRDCRRKSIVITRVGKEFLENSEQKMNLLLKKLEPISEELYRINNQLKNQD